MAEGNRGRRRWQGNLVSITRRLDPLRSRQYGRLGGDVVVAGARTRVDQDSAVEHPTDDDRDRQLFTKRQQLVHCHLIEERVAAGNKKDIEVACLDKPGQHRRLVHAGADGSGGAFFSQLGKGPEPGSAGSFEMVVWIVEEQDVKPVEPGPPEALRNRRHDPVVTEVPNRSYRRDVLVEGFAEIELALIARRVGAEQPANLGGYDDLVTWKSRHGSAHPLLAKALSRERRPGEISTAMPDIPCHERVSLPR